MKEDIQLMTIRLPKPVHEKLRLLAFDIRKSMNEIAVAAIIEWLSAGEEES